MAGQLGGTFVPYAADILVVTNLGRGGPGFAKLLAACGFEQLVDVPRRPTRLVSQCRTSELRCTKT